MEEELRKNRKRESQKGSANADSLQAASASLQKQPHASGNTTVAGMPPKTSEKQEEELRLQEKEVEALKNDVNSLKLKVLQNTAISKKIIKEKIKSC